MTIFAHKLFMEDLDMGNTVSVKETLITTNEGLKLIRRVRTVRMPNGRYRYPVDYYDATPGAVRVTREELERIRIPVYKQLI
jgi:hypothetical protein